MTERTAPARGWRLTLRPIEAEAWRAVPADVRVRRAVKVLRRGFGLRVVEVEAEPSPGVSVRACGPIGNEGEPSPCPGAVIEPEAP